MDCYKWWLLASLNLGVQQHPIPAAVTPSPRNATGPRAQPYVSGKGRGPPSGRREIIGCWPAKKKYGDIASSTVNTKHQKKWVRSKWFKDWHKNRMIEYKNYIELPNFWVNWYPVFKPNPTRKNSTSCASKTTSIGTSTWAMGVWQLTSTARAETSEFATPISSEPVFATSFWHRFGHVKRP